MGAMRAGVAAIAVLAFGACGGGDGGPPAVATVTITPPAAQVEAGLTTQLSASAKDAQGTTLSNPITWTSSAATVASVSGTGLVTGVAAGTATITAAAGGKQGTATITVVPPSVQTVAVSLAATTIEVTRTTTATAVARDVGGNILTGRQVTWTTGNATIASVSAGGVVTGVAVGSTTVIGTSEGKTGSATITVVPPPVATVAVSLSPASVVAGATSQATFVARDAANTVLTGRVGTWSSSNQSVATINASTGAIAAVATGTATITATVEGRTGSAQLTVTTAPALGTVTGTVTAADGTTPIGDALVEVEGTSAWGGSTTAAGAPISTRSAANGTYTLQNVPAGAQVIVATRGAFQAKVTVTVVGNQTVTAPKAALVSTGKLAFVRGLFDAIQSIVSTDLGNVIEEIDVSDLADPAVTSKYQMVFLNCGLDETAADNAATIANLRAFMQAGGTIYASDFASIYVKGLFSTYDFNYAGDVQIIQATVTDASLQAFVGKTAVSIAYDLDAWTDVLQLPTGANVLLRGTYLANGIQRANQPLAFVITHGAGRLVFTTFHNEAGATQDQIAVLRHFIYLPNANVSFAARLWVKPQARHAPRALTMKHARVRSNRMSSRSGPY